MTLGVQQEFGVGEGEVLAGKYRVERVLGIGGMGVVVAAQHIQLDEKVALKILRPEALGDEDAVARYGLEARAAVKIKSQHVAGVIDVGSLPNGAPYIVMEYPESRDLDAWIEQRGPLPIEQAVEFVLQTCVAVAAVHAMGIVHQHLKPSNLFCVRRIDGQLSIKLLDFGISKRADRSGRLPLSVSVTAKGLGFTRTPALMGSPLYMSPEQMQSSREVDAGTDIWALGVILFELLAGYTPYSADAVTELAIQIAAEPTPSLRDLRPEVPLALEEVIGRCLEKDRGERYANVAELSLALLPFAPKRAVAHFEQISEILHASGLPVDSPEASPSPRSRDRQASEETLPPLEWTMRVSPGRKATAIGLGIVGAAALVASVGVMGRRLTPPDNRPATVVRTEGHAAARAAPPTDPEEPSAVGAEMPSAVRPASPDPVASTEIPATARTVPPVHREPPPRAAAPAKTANGAARCNPPFYFDGNGNRLFKKECL